MCDVANGHPKEKPAIKLGKIIGINPYRIANDNNISVKPYFGDILLVHGPGCTEKNLRKITKDTCLNWLTS